MSRSTAEAKYRILASTTGELMWFVHLLKNIGYCVPPSTLYSENINAIHIAKNTMFHHRTNTSKLMFTLFMNGLRVVFSLWHTFQDRIKLQMFLPNPFVLQNLFQIMASSVSVQPHLELEGDDEIQRYADAEILLISLYQEILCWDLSTRILPIYSLHDLYNICNSLCFYNLCRQIICIYIVKINPAYMSYNAYLKVITIYRNISLAFPISIIFFFFNNSML